MPEPLTDQPSQEFIELVQRVLDKEASLEEVAVLNQTLPDDPVALRYFVKMRLLHSRLNDELGASNVTQLTSIHEAAHGDSSVTANGSRITEQLTAQHPNRLSRPTVIKLALAAAAVILISFFAPSSYRSIMAENAYQIVATNGTSDFKRNSWMDTHTSYQLTSGSIEFCSPDNNFLTIQGPAEFTIDSHQKITLNRGRIWAKLDGKPLAIHTPQGRIEDLGTTFGVDQSKPHSTRVDVIDGAIKLTSPSKQAESVGKGKALVTQYKQWPPKQDRADASHYATSLQQSVGIAFCEYYFDAKTIEAEQPLATRWTTADTPNGSSELSHTPITVTWACGYKLFSEGGSSSAESALFRTHLLAGRTTEANRSVFESLGFSGDPRIGIIVRIEQLQPWLKQIGATGYRIQLLRNSGLQTVHFLPISIHPSETSAPIEVLNTDPSQFLCSNYPDPDDGEEGTRAITTFKTIFTNDSLTLTTPTHAGRLGMNRANISAIRIIPIFE